MATSVCANIIHLPQHVLIGTKIIEPKIMMISVRHDFCQIKFLINTSLSFKSECRYTPKPGFQIEGQRYICVVEAMLVGHEDWVHTVAWQPNLEKKDRPTLLSASMDRTMALWRQDVASG